MANYPAPVTWLTMEMDGFEPSYLATPDSDAVNSLPEYRNATSVRNVGIGLSLAGVAVNVIGIALLVVGGILVSSSDDLNRDYIALTVAGGSISLLGTVMIGTGFIFWAVGVNNRVSIEKAN